MRVNFKFKNMPRHTAIFDDSVLDNVEGYVVLDNRNFNINYIKLSKFTVHQELENIVKDIVISSFEDLRDKVDLENVDLSQGVTMYYYALRFGRMVKMRCARILNGEDNFEINCQHCIDLFFNYKDDMANKSLDKLFPKVLIELVKGKGKTKLYGDEILERSWDIVNEGKDEEITCEKLLELWDSYVSIPISAFTKCDSFEDLLRQISQ